MIIIVEGIDRIGKTTLCNKLHDKFKIPIYRHVGERNFKLIDNDVETDKFFQVMEICKLSNSFIIFDRFHFSDYIYGIIERNYNVEKANKNFNEIEEFAEKNLKDLILLLVLPTDLERSSKEHGSDLTKHNDLFYKKFKESKIKNKFRCTYNTLDEAVAYVSSVISKSNI